jgi:serine/threonine-protein kinase
MSDEPQGAEPKDRLSAGLREAFGEDPSTVRSSVLARLFARGTPPVRVLLREEAGADPLLRAVPAADRAAGSDGSRYQLQGEIARGGIGVILKAHDADLGRDVAMKVLHEEHRDNSSLLARFLEEAQVESQLQHPGIVPVYDFGLQAEERPYFTMKLIKGRTLAALLAERKGREDRRRFLGVFEQVCQTIAYAHSRGVEHRDLKPANIMVGAFGEVQVVDWGLSKVLRQGGTADEGLAHKSRISIVETVRSQKRGSGSDSLAGSVMGTPAYMPPEQAQGDLEKLDERADVFSLGAILCEILTGLPPYAGEKQEALLEAASARLDSAHELLSSCGADRELIAICESCLQPEPAERPRNAHVLAEQVASHLARVEERAAEARISVALAGEKAAGARRAQRFTMAIAASLILALSLGSGLLWIRSGHEKGRTLFASQVRARLADIRQVQGRAEAAPVGQLEDWTQAQALLAQVASLVESGDAAESLRADVADLDRAAKSGHEKANARADSKRRDETMLRALDEVVTHIEAAPPEAVAAGQVTVHSDPTNHARRRRDLYGKAFETYGLRVLDAPAELVIERIASSEIVDRLATALDDWASALRILDDENEPRLRDIAFEADRDP